MGPEIIFLLIAAVGCIILYMLPTWLAHYYERKNLVGIAILNICLGWTLLGWVGALVWSVIEDKPQEPSSQPSAPPKVEDDTPPPEDTASSQGEIPDLIQKLHDLLQSGVLTEEEFQLKKTELLDSIGSEQSNETLVLADPIIEKPNPN